MPAVSITLFGPPRIHDAETASRFRRKRGLALLAYLAAARTPEPREVLLALVWPEFDEADARNNLRRDLSLLKNALPDGALLSDRTTVDLNLEHPDLSIDIVEFERLVQAVRDHRHTGDELCAQCINWLQRAAAIYTADFLAGFSLSDSVEFDDWSLLQRNRLRADLEVILRRLVAYESAGKQWEKAIEHSLRLTELAPADDAAVRQLMRIYVTTGQPAAALRQYDQLVHRLRRDYGIEPEAATASLAQSIISPAGSATIGANADAGSQAAANHDHSLTPSSLPREPLPLIGRESELGQLAAYLNQPASRLITITGTGGAGKTRLALEVARQQYEQFSEGIGWIELDALESVDEVTTAVARVLGLSLHDGDDPWQRVLRMVKHGKRLLVFDNFEHLLEAGSLLDDLLGAGPDLRLLTTSRRPLGRRAETVFPLSGLDAESGAVALFLQRARQTDAGFDPDEIEMTEIAALARNVEGMPLALELAATWVATLTPAQIRDQVAGDADLLATEVADRPARHQSMRRTLAYSWQLLNDKEQAALARLSVFRGGFTAEAAEVVTGAALPVLRSLVAQSQIQREPDTGRYRLHELLRQFAAERLAESGDETAARRAHSEYFGRWLADRQLKMTPADQQLDTLADIERDLSNVRAGFLVAVDGALTNVEDYLPGLIEYLFRQEYTGSGEMLFRQALERYPKASNDTANHLYIAYAFQAQLRGLFRNPSPERDAILSRVSMLDPETLSSYYRTLYWLAFLDRQLMDEDGPAYDRVAVAAVASSREAGQPFLEALSLYVALEREVHPSHWDQFARLVRRTGDRYFTTVVLTFDGLGQLAKGHVHLAERQLRQAYRSAGEVDDIYGQVKVAHRLCRVLIWKRDLEGALALLDKAASQIKIYGFDHVWVENALARARICMVQGDLAGAAEALQCYELDWSLRTGNPYWLAYARHEPLPDPAPLLKAFVEPNLPSGMEPDQLIARAIVELEAGQPATAAETLAEALRHPAAPPWYATEHPIVRLLIEDLQSTSLLVHESD